MSQHFGGKFITDDIAVIRNDGGVLTVAPGYQKLRVLPEDVARIDAQISDIKGPVYTHMPKAYFEVEAAHNPVPVSMIVSLNRSLMHEGIVFHCKTGAEAFVDCIPHIFSREAYVIPDAFSQQNASLKALIVQSKYIIAEMPNGHEHIADICTKLMAAHNDPK
ncbi:hypothetical protein C8024_12015 [Sphingopyxis sp. BSNA05]|uniref:hypothetical protein n=1 Tax=Sphingopyxis sp. BSNA05 TaxID=1236614 RepID=UPI0015672367|nr:hypothetical protein [Sphingopyxis sp. BSNA05]NRD90031.1 hypothetical protein [Sphingopyxis sp. BSNA05]